MSNVIAIPKCSIPGVARCLLRAGVSVIPLSPNSKIPSIEWKNYQNAPMSEDLVNRVFNTNTGIGIVAGKISNITVIDVDDPDRFDTFYPIEKLRAQAQTIVRTARGFHFWFRYEPQLASRSFPEFGFDTKSDGGFVVVPPTSINRHKYSFIKCGIPSAIPEELLQKILSLRMKQEYQRNENVNLEEVLRKLHSITMHTPQERKPGIWRTKCPAHDDREPSLDVEVRGGGIHFKCWAGCEEEKIMAMLGFQPSKREVSLPTFEEIRSLGVSVEWIVSRLIPKQAITVLHGKGGVGKTWLMLQMGSCIADGRPFMGLSTQRIPVYYVDFENSLATLHDRAVVLGGSAMKIWHTSNTVPPPRLDSREWIRYKDLYPGLLIFDTLRSSQFQDENSSKDMAMVMVRLKVLRDLGFSIILIHHTPKSNEHIYKGSTAIQDQCDHVLSLDRVKGVGSEEEIDGNEEDWDYPLRLGVRGKTRYAPFSIYLTFDPEKGFEVAPDPDDEHLEAIHSLLVEFKTRKDLPPNQSQIVTLAKDLRINRKKLLRLLRKGEGRFWNSLPQSKSREILYDPIVPLSPPIYRENNGTMVPQNNDVFFPDAQMNFSQPIENASLSHCSEGIKNNGITEEVEVSFTASRDGGREGEKEMEFLDLSQEEVELL